MGNAIRPVYGQIDSKGPGRQALGFPLQSSVPDAEDSNFSSSLYHPRKRCLVDRIAEGFRVGSALAFWLAAFPLSALLFPGCATEGFDRGNCLSRRSARPLFKRTSDNPRERLRLLLAAPLSFRRVPRPLAALPRETQDHTCGSFD